jgi:hypothetical protein
VDRLLEELNIEIMKIANSNAPVSLRETGADF